MDPWKHLLLPARQRKWRLFNCTSNPIWFLREIAIKARVVISCINVNAFNYLVVPVHQQSTQDNLFKKIWIYSQFKTSFKHQSWNKVVFPQKARIITIITMIIMITIYYPYSCFKTIQSMLWTLINLTTYSILIPKKNMRNKEASDHTPPPP